MRKKERIINMAANVVAIVAATTFFVGAMAAIWLGVVGVRLMGSGVVLLASDWLAYTLFKEYRRQDAGGGKPGSRTGRMKKETGDRREETWQGR